MIKVSDADNLNTKSLLIIMLLYFENRLFVIIPEFLTRLKSTCFLKTENHMIEAASEFWKLPILNVVFAV